MRVRFRRGGSQLTPHSSGNSGCIFYVTCYSVSSNMPFFNKSGTERRNVEHYLNKTAEFISQFVCKSLTSTKLGGLPLYSRQVVPPALSTVLAVPYLRRCGGGDIFVIRDWQNRFLVKPESYVLSL